MTPTFQKYLYLADCFKLFSVFFYEPEMDLWEQEEILSQLFSILQKTSPGTVQAAQQMGKACGVIAEEQMKTDYAALFIGPFALPAAPYGSVYLDKGKQVMGDSTMAVLDLYREVGLKVDIKDAPDHIAIELEFIHYLYHLEAEAVQDGDHEKRINLAKLRTHFLTNYLAPWVQPFCQNIKKGTSNLFYIKLAECLDLFIAEIAEHRPRPLPNQILLSKDNVDHPPV